MSDRTPQNAEKDEVYDPTKHEHQCAADDCPNAAQVLDSSLCGGDGDYVCYRHYYCIREPSCPTLSHYEDCPALVSTPASENWNPNTAGPACDWCGECEWCRNLHRTTPVQPAQPGADQ